MNIPIGVPIPLTEAEAAPRTAASSWINGPMRGIYGYMSHNTPSEISHEFGAFTPKYVLSNS